MAHRSWKRSVVFAVLSGLLVVSCTNGSKPDVPGPSAGGSTSIATIGSGRPSSVSPVPTSASVSDVSTVELAGLKVAVAGSNRLAAVASRDPAPDTYQLQSLAANLNGHASPPVKLTASSGLPGTGAVLTRTYPAPLPVGAAATFLFFDSATNLWTAVPSILSPDRRVLTATVDHFSIWDDLWYDLGNITDERVDPPTCSDVLPSWLAKDQPAIFADDKNLPLRWCVEADANDNLVVKVRVNRGYGIAIKATTKPLKSTNSLLKADMTSVYKWVTDTAGQLAATGTLLWDFMAHNSQEVPGKGEAVLTFTEAQVRASKEGGVGLVYAEKPTPVESVMAILIGALEKELPDEGLVAGIALLLTLAHCGTEVNANRGNAFALAHALLSCLQSQADTIANGTTSIILRASPGADPKATGATVGKLVGRAEALLAAGYFGTALGTYLIDKTTIDSAYSLSVYPNVAALPTALDPNSPYRMRGYSSGQQLTADHDGGAFFSSPSGNIKCALRPGNGGLNAVCEVTQREFPPDPRPAACPYPMPWAEQFVVISSTGATAGGCIGDVLVPHESNVLPYGTSLTNGSLTCSSAPDGVTCTDMATGNGFIVSKERFIPYTAAGPITRNTSTKTVTTLDFAAYLGTWGRHTSSLTIGADHNGTLLAGGGCCNSIKYTLHYDLNGDGTLAGTVLGQPVVVGYDSSRGPGYVFKFHLQQMASQNVLVSTNPFGSGLPDINWCKDGTEAPAQAGCGA